MLMYSRKAQVLDATVYRVLPAGGPHIVPPHFTRRTTPKAGAPHIALFAMCGCCHHHPVNPSHPISTSNRYSLPVTKGLIRRVARPLLTQRV